MALNGGTGNRNNQNRDYVDNTSDTVEEMVKNKFLEKFINIQPTLYRNHGDIVGVYNRDVDFSSVYKLPIKKRARIIKQKVAGMSSKNLDQKAIGFKDLYRKILR